MKKLTMHGPVILEAKVAIINEETGDTGTATIELPTGRFPTTEDMQEVIDKVAKEVEPASFRLMTRKEFMKQLIREKTGSDEKFAVPGPNAWDEPQN